MRCFYEAAAHLPEFSLAAARLDPRIAAQVTDPPAHRPAVRLSLPERAFAVCGGRHRGSRAPLTSQARRLFLRVPVFRPSSRATARGLSPRRRAPRRRRRHRGLRRSGEILQIKKPTSLFIRVARLSEQKKGRRTAVQALLDWPRPGLYRRRTGQRQDDAAARLLPRAGRRGRRTAGVDERPELWPSRSGFAQRPGPRRRAFRTTQGAGHPAGAARLSPQ